MIRWIVGITLVVSFAVLFAAVGLVLAIGRLTA